MRVYTNIYHAFFISRLEYAVNVTKNKNKAPTLRRYDVVELQLDVVADRSQQPLFVPQSRKVHGQRVIESVHVPGRVIS